MFKLIVLLLICCSACSMIPRTESIKDANINIDFPSMDEIKSVPQADAVLAAVALSRAQVEWIYRQNQQICYDKFFTNACLIEARKQYRNDSARINKSEVAAKFFKRKSTVEEMDKALAEKNIARPLPEGVIPPDKKQSDNNLIQSH